MEISQADERYMKQALSEALKASERDEVPVGAVIVANGKIIARAHNLTLTLNDPTAHAEMQAITAAAEWLGSRYLNDCTLYVTLEPCVMCAGAIFWSRIGTVVFGCRDPKQGYSLQGKNLLHPDTVVRSGIMEKECSEILSDFFRGKR